jgi:hypothetical protein
MKRRRTYGRLEIPGLPAVTIRSEQVAGVLAAQQRRIAELEAIVSDLQHRLANEGAV